MPEHRRKAATDRAAALSTCGISSRLGWSNAEDNRERLSLGNLLKASDRRSAVVGLFATANFRASQDELSRRRNVTAPLGPVETEEDRHTALAAQYAEVPSGVCSFRSAPGMHRISRSDCAHNSFPHGRLEGAKHESAKVVIKTKPIVISQPASLPMIHRPPMPGR